MTSLYVDAREDEQHDWTTKLRKLGIDAKVGKNLPADMIWSSPAGMVIVERKTWVDFVASLTTSGGADAASRFVGQLVETSKGAGVKVLLIEGAMPPYIQGGGRTIPAEDFDNAMLSLQWQYGCVLIHSLNMDHTPIRISKFFHYTQKEEHRSILRPMPPMPDGDIYMNAAFRKKIAAMMCVPGMGEKGALLIAESTASPQAAVNMVTEELMRIPGMGKKRVEDWRAFWSGW